MRSAESLVQQQQEDMPSSESKAATLSVKTRPHSHQQHGSNNKSSSRKVSAMDLAQDELAPLELVQRAVNASRATHHGSPKQTTHSRSSSHDSYFEARRSGGGNDASQADSTPTEAKPRNSSHLDLSEIQMNFDLEENEMKIFSEDEAMMTESAISDLDLNKSPMTEEFKPVTAPAKRSLIQEDSSSPGKCRKMSFKEKFRRFTSPTPNRKSETATLPPPEKTMREKIVCALSPESLRKKAENGGEGSPLKKRKAVESSVIEDKAAVEAEVAATAEETPKSLMPLSPSINFIDALPAEEATAAPASEAKKEAKPATTGKPSKRYMFYATKYDSFPFFSDLKSFRISMASSTDVDEDGAGVSSSQLDQLVVAQVHHDPIAEEEVRAPPPKEKKIGKET